MGLNRGWLIDKSALARFRLEPFYEAAWPRVASGQVSVSICTELEMGFSARSKPDYLETQATLIEQLIRVDLPHGAEARARDTQARLVERGQHRAVSVPDLLIAATAEVEGLTVLHYDADFDLIAEITGQPTEWIVPRGTV